MKDYKNNKKQNENHLVRWVIVFAVVILAAFLVYITIKIGQPVSTDAPDQVFVVSAGESGKQISQNLEEDGIISKPFFFDLYSFYKGYSGKIQAGDYLLSRSMSVREIARKMVSGQAITDSVILTLIEGWSINEVAAEVQKSGIASRTEFISIVGQPRIGGADDFSEEFPFLASVPSSSSLEGFLFPDTYFIDKDAEAADVVRKLLQNFDTKLDEGLRKKIEKDERDLYEIITLASIVEREVGRNVKKGTVLSKDDRERVSRERRVVAGIFLNRLSIGMALESDATVGYITGSSSSRATIAETNINSPYNTYRNLGLPPGPIANPSLDSIRAAIDPEETDYLYFLTSPDGTAHFAETFEGHQINRANYLD